MFRRAGVLVVTAVLALSGCASATSQKPPDSSQSGAVTVSDCGQQLSFPAAPTRAVTLDQASSETMLALGLADHMAGTSYLKTKIAPQFAAAYAKVPVLSKTILTSEQLRAANPDVVVAGSPALFTSDRVGTRQELQQIGLPSYVSLAGCPGNNSNPFDLLLQDYQNLGRIFRVPEAANKLVADQRAVLDQAAAAKKTVTATPSVVWIYSVFNGAPYVAGNNSMPSAMSKLVGARNVFDDVNQSFPQVSWEQIAQRNPDFIVIGDLSERGLPGDSAGDKLNIMRQNPAVSQMDAMLKNRIITVPGIEMDPSVRSVQALQLLIEGMRKLGYVH